MKTRCTIRRSHCDPLQSEPWQPQCAVCRSCLSLSSPPAASSKDRHTLARAPQLRSFLQPKLKHVWEPAPVEDWEHSEGADLYPPQRWQAGIPSRVLRENLTDKVRTEPGSPEEHQVTLLCYQKAHSTQVTCPVTHRTYKLLVCK